MSDTSDRPPWLIQSDLHRWGASLASRGGVPVAALGVTGEGVVLLCMADGLSPADMRQELLSLVDSIEAGKFEHFPAGE